MERSIILSIAVALSLCLSCQDKGVQSTGINPNIVLVKSCCSDRIGGNYRMGVWHENRIYSVAPIWRLTMNNKLSVLDNLLIDDSLEPIAGYGYRFFRYLTINGSGNKLLLVMSLYDDISVGDLVEINLESNQIRVLRDSSFSISSALYLPGDTTVVYYSYGHPSIGTNSGYYYLNLRDGQDTLILSHIAEVGPSEVTNGFDISPDGRKLLFPLNYASGTPRAVEFDMDTHTFDTLNVNFGRQMLSLRYNPKFNQIVYSNYPRGSGGSTVSDNSEIGVIDRATLTKRLLDVNTNPGGLSISVLANWSPDGKDILYGSAPGPASEPPGAKGLFSLYVLKDVN